MSLLHYMRNERLANAVRAVINAAGEVVGLTTAKGITVPISANVFRAASNVPVSIIAAAATFVTLTAATNAGKTQISSAGAHDLTTSPAVGKKIYVSWSGTGYTGVDGLYEILSVDSTTAITVDLPYAASLGTPSVNVAAAAVLVASVLVPANTLAQSSGQLTFEGLISQAGTAGVVVKFGGVDFIANTPASSRSTYVTKRLYAQANSVLRAMPTTVFAPGTSGSSTNTLSVDQSADQVLTIALKPSVANEQMTLEGYSVIVEK